MPYSKRRPVLRRGRAGLAFDPNDRRARRQREAAARRAMEAVVPVATIALPASGDDARLFGGDAVEAFAGRWRRWGAEIVAVKCGAVGANESFAGYDCVMRPAVSTKPIDTTAAGASFNAECFAAVAPYQGAIAPGAAPLAKTV